MTSFGKRQSESRGSAQGQEVLWLAACEPPAQLLTFLRSRGLNLVARDQRESVSPLKLLQIGSNGSPIVRAPSLAGRRVAVMHPDPGNADALAQSLRAKGAEVIALSLNPDSLQRAELLDPDAVIMETSDFSSSCWEIVRALWQHPHLRFTTIILATPELMGHHQVSALDVQVLSVAINEVAQEYERVRDAAKNLDRFSFELNDLGPSRSLRALLESGRSLRALFSNDETSIEIDLAEQIIVGAQSPAGAAPGEGLLGVHALNLLLSRRSARVDVRCVDHPAHTNVMAPLDTALHMARDAASSVRPSGLQRPSTVEARAATREPNKEVGNKPAVTKEAPSKEISTKSQKPPVHNRTLIGVPAVQIDPALIGTKTKPGTAPTPAAPPPPTASQPEPSMPARPPTPSVPAPVQRSFAPPPRRSEAALEPVAAQGELSLPRAVPSTTRPLRVSKTPPRPPRVGPEDPSGVPDTIEIAPELALAPEAGLAVNTPGPMRSASAQSSLETIKLVVHVPDPDAAAVRALRARPGLGLPRRAGWLGGGIAASLIVGWLLVRGTGSAPEVSPLASAPQLVPHARAAEPLPAAVTAAPAAALPAVEAPSEQVLSEEAPVGRQNRATARRAGQLSNQGNAFRTKKMFPSARVRYLEALRVYPEYPRALAGLAQLALSTGDATEGIQYAKQLVKARPGQAAYQLLLGDAYRAARDEKEARAAYQTAQRLGSRSAEERLAK